MKVLFLDCDGVINRERTFREEQHTRKPLDPYCLMQLQRIAHATGAKVVISSGWRYDSEVMKFFSEKFEEYDIRIHGVTPADEPGEPRARDIREYISCNPVREFAILDDDARAGEGMGQNFFKTMMRYGLTKKVANQVIRHLGTVR